MAQGASPHPRKQPFLIVGVGASAGGLAAFKSFLAKMPADIGMAFVLVQHLAPTHKSMLVELLKPHTSMPVIEARDRVEVEKNHIYVIPPDSTLTMEGNFIRVDIPAPERPHLFTVIQAMARLTLRHSSDLKDFEARFGDRISGLSHSNDLLMQQNWHGVRLVSLIKAQLAPFIESNEKLLEMNGPDVFIAADAVQLLGLAIHELATNAAKYGALSVPEGKIALHWSFHEGSVAPDYFQLVWQERGGPAVKTPKRKGFGSFVTEQMIKREVKATAEIRFAPDGIVWTLHIPASYAERIETSGANAHILEHGEEAP